MSHTENQVSEKEPESGTSNHSVVNLADRRCVATYYTARIVPEGRKYRQWGVICRAPDGTEELCNLYRRESDARWMVNLWQKVDARRQRERNAFIAHPIGRLIASMPDDAMDLVGKMLDYERQVRSEDNKEA
jgi:hypothetical protein